jgi:protein SCO1
MASSLDGSSLMRPLLPPALRPAALAFALLGAAPAGAALDESAALRASQQALGRELRDVTFLTATGERLRLSELRGQPVVISMIYTSCPAICPATTRQLAAAVGVARGVLGPAGFAVLSVGFDTVHDTPQALKAFAAEQRVADARWWFVTASPADIARLTADTGFWYAPGSGMFDHLIQTTLLDGRGRVVRQLYGNEFGARELIDPLRKAALGAPLTDADATTLWRRVRLLCTVYDARLGRYRIDYSLAVSLLIALTTLIALLVVVVRAWRGGPPRGAA